MKKLSIILVCAVVLLIGGNSLHASTYFVSTNGVDANTGTAANTPWKTITKVNGFNFSAGDVIQFQGGQTFTGSLAFDNSGTSNSPITYTSFGGGAAVINSGTLNGSAGSSLGGIIVSNINFSGNGSLSSSTAGISFSGAGSFVRIDSVNASGYGQAGIYFTTSTKGSGYSNVRITNCTVTNCGYAGIYVEGVFDTKGTGTYYSHSNFYIGACNVYNIPGRAADSQHSGNGIYIYDIDTATVEHCLIHDTGTNDTACGGPVGLWCFQANHILFQYNEAYHNHDDFSNGGCDGDGIDFDGGTVNSTMQYNYSHDNYGAGILVWEFKGARPISNDVVRYNICQNNGTKGNFYAEVTTGKDSGGAAIDNVQIYNNTFSAATGSWACAQIDGPLTSSGFRDNLLVSTNGVPLVTIANSTFQGNNYWSSGGAFKILTYTSLSAWRTATSQETLSNNPVGFSINPLLTAPGTGGTIGYQGDLTTLSAYQLLSSSLMATSGLNLHTLFGLNVGTADFYGTALPVGSYYPIGAATYISLTPPIITDLQFSGGNVELSFLTQSNRTYSVQSTTNLTNGWSTVTNGIPGTGGEITVIDPGAAANPQDFYRVELTAP